MMRRLGTYHELFLDVPDAGMWGNPVTLGFTPEELAPPVSLEQFDSVLHSLIFQVQQTPAPEGKNGVKNKELFMRFLNGFSQYARLGRVRFRTEGGSAWAITVEEAREKFRDSGRLLWKNSSKAGFAWKPCTRCAEPAPRTG